MYSGNHREREHEKHEKHEKHEENEMTETQCAEAIALTVADRLAEGFGDEAYLVAVNDTWLESTGELHKFATRLRNGDVAAQALVTAEIGR